MRRSSCKSQIHLFFKLIFTYERLSKQKFASVLPTIFTQALPKCEHRPMKTQCWIPV